jgi:CubicO group peptidase (beta-lactamase class C family)
MNSMLIIQCSNPDKPKPGNGMSVKKNIKRADSNKIDEFVLGEMKKQEIPGISMAVVHRGTIIYGKCFGLANLEHSITVTPQSPFKIASLTKPITAIAVMQLAEKGEILLDKSLNYYLDYLPKEWREITIRQLLSHTSGLSDYFQSPDWSWRNSWRLDLSHDEVIRMCAKSPILYNPGERMQYCNMGYYLLGMLIEEVSKMSYEEYLHEHIFKALRMSNSRLDNAQAIIPGRVSGYTLYKGELRNAEFTGDTWAYSEGGIITTTEDLAKLDSSLYSEGLIGAHSIQQMWAPTKLGNGKDGIIGDNGAGKPNYYGLGWFISDYKNHKLISCDP